MVKLILEDNIPLVIEELVKGKRTKQETKNNALAFQRKLVQAGFRLMALLAAAPEVVAKESINQIKNPEAAKEVVKEAVKQSDYLESYHGLHEAGKDLGFKQHHHIQINKHNNKLINAKEGERQILPKYKKDTLTILQTIERMRLDIGKEREEFESASEAYYAAKDAGTRQQEFTMNLLNS